MRSIQPTDNRAASAPTLLMDDVIRDYLSSGETVHALRGISLAVHPGELVAVMGPSGSGKSTLMMIAGGLLSPSSGSVMIEGESLTGLSQSELAVLRRRRVGVVFQDYNLVPSLTAAENVALPLELDGVGPRAAHREAVMSLEAVGLPGLGARFPDELSGGQRQRVAIARALVGTRRLVLADEPTGALDSETGAEVLSTLRTLVDGGVAAVIVTHDREVASFADRIVVVRDGHIDGGSTTGPLPTGGSNFEANR